MTDDEGSFFTLRGIGRVVSPLTSASDAPKQGHEGAPDAWIVIEPAYLPGIRGLQPGGRLVILTWLHQADRTVLEVHPRDNPANPLTGVFGTRSADRPNPIGLHPVTLHEIAGNRIRVGPLEAVDGTPVLDIKVSL